MELIIFFFLLSPSPIDFKFNSNHLLDTKNTEINKYQHLDYLHANLTNTENGNLGRNFENVCIHDHHPLYKNAFSNQPAEI